jgi:methyl-accepting chemotaxis protein
MKKTSDNGGVSKKPYVSIALRVPVIVACAVAVVVAIISFVFGFMTFRTADAMSTNQIKNVANQNKTTVQQYVDGMNIYAQALGTSILNFKTLGHEKGETAIINSLNHAVESGKIFSAYFAFEPNALFPDTPNGLSYYVYQSGDSLGTDILNDYEVYKSGDYYAPTKEKLMPHITDPFDYTLTDGKTVTLITLSTPVLENGKFIGVANCSMLLDTVGTLNYTNGGYNTIHFTIYDSNGTYIANTGDPSTVGKSSEMDSALFAQVQQADQVKNEKDKIGGAASFVVYKPITLEGTDLQWMITTTVHINEVRKDIYTSLLIVTFIGIIGTVVLGFVASLAVRKALAPINPLMRVAEDVGNFDLNSDNGNQNYSNDEIGVLAGIFKNMSGNLGQIITDVDHLLASMANGDFTVTSTCPEKYVGDMHSTLESINQIKSTLGSSLREINESASRVASNSSQISDGSQALAQGATEQAGSVEELSATINNVNEDVKGNAQNAEHASDIAMKTKEAIAVSNAEMRKLTDSMDAIEESSNKIQDVITIIDNIAFQTNILSLNAAIEAARAGQAGKGFAVVADEVGNLAKRSQEAAQSTSDLIQMVTDAVNKGKGITDDTAAALDRVSGFADETNNMITQISEASKKQADALNQISVGINQISMVVQQNSSTSEQSAAASIELANEANKLHDLVEPFQLP